MSEIVDSEARLSPMHGRDPRSESFATRFTRSELDILSEAAKAEGKTVREWARDVLLREAGRGVPDRVIVTEVTALRLQIDNLHRQLNSGERPSPKQYDEMTVAIRRGKHKVAREVVEQYTITGGE